MLEHGNMIIYSCILYKQDKQKFALIEPLEQDQSPGDIGPVTKPNEPVQLI